MQQQLQNASQYATRKLADGAQRLKPTMNSDQWTAICVWLIGVWATRVMIMQLHIEPTTALGVALILQWILTRLERRVWLRKIGIAPLMALALDMASNAAGLFVYVQRFGQTDVWHWLQVATQSNAEFSTVSAVALSAALGYAIAKTPEELWNN